jgi:hypothetical protein
MLNSDVIKKILSISDDRSGDHAQDGFDFQASTAIYLVFTELVNKNDFSLVYEKIDDFIIFADDVRLYQSKSTAKNLTSGELSKKEPVKNPKASNKTSNIPTNTKNNNSVPIKTGLSIIEKLQNNMDSVTNNVSGTGVKAYLLWNEDFKFGASLLKGTKIKTDSPNLVMSHVDNNIKQKIIQDTGVSKYDWNQIEIIRLLSKKNHEKLTCNHIEYVIYTLIGQNSSYSKAFYESLINVIRDSRKTKEPITSQFLITEINKLKSTPSLPKPSDYQHLLSGVDFGNQIIHMNVREVFLLSSIDTHPLHDALKKIENYVNINYAKITFPSNLYDELKKQPEFDSLLLRHSEEQIKALIVNVYL